MMQREKTIDIRDLAIGYTSKRNRRVVAENVNCSIFSGELTCLLGANGIGKSTLLRTLSAFQPKLFGDIYIQDREIEEYAEKELSTLISVVLTDKFEIKNMTTHELIGLGRSPYTGFWGRLSKEDRAIVDKSISLVKIENLRQRMVHTLSDGERQKVMIAKALAQETPIVLLDEPTAFLDFPSKVEIMQLLHQLSRKTNKTIFLSTHDLELALQIADKIWLMDKGIGIRIGTPEDLSLNGSLSRFFARKGIILDQHTGLFRVENDYTKQIKILGHGQMYAMIRKALQRNGIMASCDIESDFCIEIVGDDIRILKLGKCIASVYTIEELLEKIVIE
ncbi:ABC transporter ATP-binding protein [Dysgonomonas sp. Marseille-P4677]|uniref:ABC transporter ATP-binding protein n=1 Tax=Dysgonomonas sp. Marseille-P4677 TaxID=2364790 RepID=UPI0019143DD2|nr:ABC transporter ATP-binding protein [Dysgonomonas sp. Marseille-P4677]MBK5720383.1 ABC transporter ATP-binding protein [Dysgonomonas sp. Marseille-P4677]